MIKKAIALLSTVVLFSCGNNSETKTEGASEVKKDSAVVENTQPQNELAEFKFTTLVINVPSPFEIIGDLSKTQHDVNNNLLNSVDNEKKYTSSAAKGLNYGVYVVDLVYISMHNRFSEIKPYFKTARSLAQSLGCAQSFDRVAGARMENNIDKKDSVNKVMDELYADMDKYLRSNDRVLTATQILVGSWVESQYLTVSLIKDAEKNKDNELLFPKVAQQKNTADKLVELLVEFEKEKDMKVVISGVKDLQALYDKDVKEGALDKAALAKLYQKLSVLRGKITG